MKLVLLIFFLISINAQQISINVNELNKSNVKLYSISGERKVLIDSIEVIACKIIFNGSEKNLINGLYRIGIDKSNYINFIYDNKDIQIETRYEHINDSLEVLNSESNKLFYEFFTLTKKYKIKNELLQVIITRYPDKDEYYDLTKNKLDDIQNQYMNFAYKISQKNPDAFISRYIKSARLPITNYALTLKLQLENLKKHALDNINFNDAELIHSDLFANRVIEYLNYYSNPQLPKELLEKEFMKAIDVLLDKAKINQAVYLHIVEYLLDGFKRFGFDNVLNYIVENYVIKDDLCLDEKTEGMIKRRIDQAKVLKVGEIIPDIELPNTKGKMIKLSNLSTDKKLIVFYATRCPHCKNLLPEIYKKYKGKLDVLAISLDTDKQEWKKFVKENCPDWNNLSDLKGWNSSVTSNFYLYATPTMFLVDKMNRILGKPLTLNELKKLL